jgi:hypothetical protein
MEGHPKEEYQKPDRIVIYGLPPSFDPKGIMRDLLYGLKESEKELCDGQKFPFDQNIACWDMPLPLFNGYYKQSTPPQGSNPLSRIGKLP